MTTRILPAVGDPDAARAVGTLLSRLPGRRAVPPAVDSTRLLDSLAQAGRATRSTSCPRSCWSTNSSGPLPALELIREVALRFPAVGVVLHHRRPGPSPLLGGHGRRRAAACSHCRCSTRSWPPA